MQDSENGTTCMCVKRVAESVTVCAKQCHASDSIEMIMKTEKVLVQANMNENENKHS